MTQAEIRRLVVRAAAEVAGEFRMPARCVLNPAEQRQSLFRPAHEARAVVAYVVHTAFGVSMRKVAKALDVHHSRVVRHTAAIEDRRDDPVFDTRLSRIEQRIEGVL